MISFNRTFAKNNRCFGCYEEKLHIFDGYVSPFNDHLYKFDDHISVCQVIMRITNADFLKTNRYCR